MAGSYLPRAVSAPPKKGMAMASLVLGILSLPSCAGAIVGGLTGLILGIVALVKTNRAPNEYGGKGLAIGGIVTSGVSFLLIPVMGIISAIAIPSLLRARTSANDAAALGDLRAFISAEAAYQSASGGVYGTPGCLAKPAGCILNYQGPTFVDEQLASLAPKSGYRRTFIPGPNRGQGLESYAFVLEPALRNQSGIRAFCGDASGVICATADGSAPSVADGACDLGGACQPLR